MRIYIGTSANGEDAVQEKILEYSLRKHATEDVEIVWMRNNDSYLEMSNHGWATPFSGFRWTVPEMCNFEGRALYMDVDMLNLRDISILYNMDLKGKSLSCRAGGRTCVMVMDCEKCKHWMPSIAAQNKGQRTHMSLYSKARSHFTPFDARWNCLDGENYKIDDIWHLHFTRMNSQPWKPSWFRGKTVPHKRKDIQDLWYQYKEEANA